MGATMAPMNSWTLIKAVHVGCVVLSGAGFVARGALRAAGSPWLSRRFVRVAPHVVDTLLLASAIALAWQARLWPPDHPWLAAKIVALFAYIGLGSVALKHGAAPVRLGAFVLALLTFGYIVLAALTRTAWPWT
jgi:uncharacterized membrane protein SirB2